MSHGAYGDVVKTEDPDHLTGVMLIRFGLPDSDSDTSFVEGVVFVGVVFSWRHVKVTDRRTKRDFAECMRDLVDTDFPKAKRINIVMDNLNTHRPSALSEASPPAKARRILRRVEFDVTPKHASWLNTVTLRSRSLHSPPERNNRSKPLRRDTSCVQ
jgi:hypothetical protein